MEGKVTVNSSSSEPPQVSNLLVSATPAPMTSLLSASSTESSLTSIRSGASEEFRRKVVQAITVPHPPPPPNVIIRDPNNPRQMVGTTQELGSSGSPPVQPMSEESSQLLPPESENGNLEPIPAILVPTPSPTPINMDETGVLVMQQKQQLPQSETTNSVENGSSRPSEVIQPERESSQKLKKAEEEGSKLTEDTKRGCADSTLVTGPSPLVAKAVESAIGDETVCEVRMRDERMGVSESLASVSEKERSKAEKPVSKPAAEENKTTPPNESMLGCGGYCGGPTHHTTVPTLQNVHPQRLLPMPLPPGGVRGAPLQQIPGLPPTQPTMQVHPLPVQQPYTRKPRGRNSIRIINPDMGDEVKIDSGSSEPPHVPTPPVTATPALTILSLGASSTENFPSSTRSDTLEEFRRKVAQATNSEPRPPPPPNAIIRDPNHPRQMVGTRQESDLLSMQPLSAESSKLLPPESEKANLEPPTAVTPTAPIPTSTPALTPSLTPTHMDTPVGGGPGSDETGIVVLQEEKQLSASEASEALQPEREGESAQKQKKAEEEEIKTTETKETERGGTDLSLVTGPFPLAAEAVESTTGEKSTKEVPIQPVQQEKAVSIPVKEELQTTHPPSENISEPTELPNSSILLGSQDTDFTSAHPPVRNTEKPPARCTKREIPPTTEDKCTSSEPVVASKTETLTCQPTSETADSRVQNEQKGPMVEGASAQEIQPQSEVGVTPKPPGQKIGKRSSVTPLPESSETVVTTEVERSQSSQPIMIGEEADSVGRTELPEEQEEDGTEVMTPAETDCEARMEGISLEPLVSVEPQAPNSPLMESVTERIAHEVGPKWIQLYSRLGLGPRDRWRIDSEHKDKPTETKWQNCARDCIQLWRKTVQHLDEMEAIRELLIALRKVQGFIHLAEELSRIVGTGISLEPLVSVEPQAPNSPLMESVTERIAHEVGPKWIQLYSRLGLGPRDRWWIDCKHKDKPTKTKWQNCARDCIQLWRKTVQHLDEMEAIRELLIALRKVQGFIHLAEELSKINGISLEPLVSVKPQAPNSPLMESVTERIAHEVGPKWIQLYSRLGLGPRDRWRIDSEHKDKPTETKWRNCARDCIQLWRKTVQHLDEMEAIRELLIALRKVQGFVHLSEELSRIVGISLEPLVSVEPQAPNSPLMESVTERIAHEVGPKWIQLYSRLGLGPRDRWRIDSEHKDKPTETKWQNCARDCIQLWRKTVQHLDEMEAIRELLIALRKVQGFVHLAEELSRIVGTGISLEPLVSVEPQAPNSPLMESVTERIAHEVGPKWIQLYSRLGLGPRDRWWIDCKHKDKPTKTKWQNCARDCIQLWRKTVQHLDEMEAVRELLIALRNVRGFIHFAEELSKINGISLEPLVSVKPQAPNSPLMESVTKKIAHEVGPKWIQLYSRLGLGPGDRWWIDCKHKDKPTETKWQNCARDCIQLWRKTVQHLDEMEAIRELLIALRKVRGFVHLSEALSRIIAEVTKPAALKNRQAINKKFMDLLMNVCNKMLENGIDIEVFRLFIVALFPPGYCIPQAPTNLTKVFEAITHHGLWDCLHYFPLVQIVQKFGAGDPEMEAWIRNYKEDLKAYTIVTSMKDYIDSDLDTCADQSQVDTAKYDPRYNCPVKWETDFADHSLQHLINVWELFSVQYLGPDSPPTALLDHVHKDSMLVMWIVPAYLIPQLNKRVAIDTEFFHEHCILKVTVKGEIVYKEEDEIYFMKEAQNPAVYLSELKSSVIASFAKSKKLIGMYNKQLLTEKFGGYDCAFVEPPQSAFQTECLICCLILRLPHQVTCCGTNYCHTCCQQLQADNSPCPSCRVVNFQVFPNKGLNRSLKQLRVYCTYRKYYCQWTGELGELDRHLLMECKHQTAKESMTDEEAKIHFEEAMKNGYVECTMTTCAVTGAAGSGKSHTMYLALNEDPPDDRQSTGLVEPVRALSTVVGAGTSKSGSSEWSRVDEDKLLSIVVGATSVTNAEEQPAVQTSPSPATQSESLSISLPLATPQELITLEQPECCSEAEIPCTSLPLVTPQDNHTREQPECSSEADISGTSLPLALTTPQDMCTQEQAESSSQADISGTSLALATPQNMTQEQPQSSSEADISELLSKPEQAPHTEVVDELLIKLASLLDKPVGRRRVTKLDFLYFLDSGGQPQFHELLPSFVPNLSTILFVLKLSEKLSQHPVIEYYKESKSLSSYQSPYSHEQILKHCIRALQPENRSVERSSSNSPHIAVVGTHRDLESQCEGETREEKNQKLLDLLQPRFGDSLIFYDQLKELIYPINAKNPSKEDRAVAGELREATIRSSAPKSVQIPLPWFMLEQVLRKLAKERGTGIMHIEECRIVASSLHMKPNAFDAALKYLVRLNVFLYYPTMLPGVVFCVPQVFLDKLNELVQCRHILCGGFGILPGCAASTKARGLTGKWLRFRNYGVFKEELLQDNAFSRHYDPDLFTPADFLKLLESLLIVGKVNTSDINTEYVMPSLLFELESDKLDKYRGNPRTSPAAPLLIHFPGEWPTSGVFCSFLASLLSAYKWEVMIDARNKPTCLYRNCCELQHPEMMGKITLIDSFDQGYFEVHVNAHLEECEKYCPKIREAVLKALPPKAPVAHEIAFFCPNSKGDIPCPSSLHLACMKLQRNYWRCTESQGEVYGSLSETPNMAVWGIAGNSTSDMKPRMAQLMRLNSTEGDSLKIIESISPVWKDIGYLMDLDATGQQVERIETEHSHKRNGLRICCQEMFKLWLGSPDATWGNLIKLLVDSEHRELAKQVQDAVGL